MRLLLPTNPVCKQRRVKINLVQLQNKNLQKTVAESLQMTVIYFTTEYLHGIY